jgi:LEA14-like dessication related protein
VIVVGAAAYFLLAGGQPQIPQITGMTHSWGRVTIESTEILTKATVHNPNNFPIYFTKVEYTIYMNNIKMGQGSSEEDVIIRANSDKTIDLTTVIDNTKLAEWWVSHINNGEKTVFKLDGYIYFDLKVTTFKYHFELTQEFQTNILG